MVSCVAGMCGSNSSSNSDRFEVATRVRGRGQKAHVKSECATLLFVAQIFFFFANFMIAIRNSLLATILLLFFFFML